LTALALAPTPTPTATTATTTTAAAAAATTGAWRTFFYVMRKKLAENGLSKIEGERISSK